MKICITYSVNSEVSQSLCQHPSLSDTLELCGDASSHIRIWAISDFLIANHMHPQLSFAWLQGQLCISEMQTRNKRCMKIYDNQQQLESKQ